VEEAVEVIWELWEVSWAMEGQWELHKADHHQTHLGHYQLEEEP